MHTEYTRQFMQWLLQISFAFFARLANFLSCTLLNAQVSD